MSDPLNPTPSEPTPEVPPTPAAETPVEPVVPVEPAPAAAPVAEPAAPAYAAPAAPAYPAAAPVAAAPRNALATASLVLGIVALVLALLTFIPFAGPFFFGWVGFIAAVLAIVFGIIGLNRAKLSSVGKSKAQTGLVLGIVAVVLGIIALILSIIWGAAIIANAGGYVQEIQSACASQPSGSEVTLSNGVTVTCP